MPLSPTKRLKLIPFEQKKPYKIKMALQSLIDDLKQRDKKFKNESEAIVSSLESGKINERKAEELYHQILDQAIKRQKLQ